MRRSSLISLLLAFLLALVLFLWRSGCGNTKQTACDNSINQWKHFISYDTANAYIQRLKTRKKLVPGLGSNNVAVSELFDSARDMMRNMMLRDTCLGIRVYYGLKEDRIIPIVCGVKANGSDIYWRHPDPALSSSTNSLARTTGTLPDVDGLLDVSDPEPPKMAPAGAIH